MSDERKKVMFLVGVESLDDHLERLEQSVTPEEEDEVEFVSPRVPNRLTWNASTGRREAEQKQAESDSSEEG
jgi:hypothetical protein